MNTDDVIKAIPAPAEIERLMEAGCPHGTPACDLCLVGGIFEATVRSLAPNLGVEGKDAEAFASAVRVNAENPLCSHIECELPSRWKGRLKIQIRGAGPLTGIYHGEVGFRDEGLCDEHRKTFAGNDPANHRQLADEICRAQGQALPCGARIKVQVEWRRIVPATC